MECTGIFKGVYIFGSSVKNIIINDIDIVLVYKNCEIEKWLEKIYTLKENIENKICKELKKESDILILSETEIIEEDFVLRNNCIVLIEY